MDNISTSRWQINRRDEIVSWLLLIFVISSFCIHYYTYLLRSYVLYAGVVAVAAAGIFSLCWKRFLNSVSSICVLWYAAAVMICINILRTPFDINTYVDMVTFAAGCVMLGCCGRKKKTFDKAFYVIIAFALYFAVTLWIQVLLPEVYAGFVSKLPVAAGKYVYKLEEDGLGYTGFTINPGFTAAHMIAGIFVICAKLYVSKISGRKMAAGAVALAFLFLSVFMTGKRAPLLFLAITLVVMVFIPLDAKTRKKWLKIGGISAVAFVVLALVFQNTIRMIPVFDRLFESVEALISGEDVSSNRNKLYALAWKHAKENPFFGIGWNQYRKTVVGVITYINELDVHNIYLQMLCEIGFVGLLIVVVPMFTFCFATFKAARFVSVRAGDKLGAWKMPLLFSVSYQFYFLIYGFTENPLYDHNYVLMYFFSCAITAAFLRAKEQAACDALNTPKMRILLQGFVKRLKKSH